MKPIQLVVFLLLPLLSLAAEGEKHALLIGIQEYTGSGLGNLKYCEEDVHALAEVLPSLGYLKENTIILSRRSAKERDKDVFRPTAANVRKWLKSVCEDARGNDSVLLAFAGHGVQLKGDGKMYFCPLDCDLNKVETLISLDELYATMDTVCKARVKLLLVDACRNDPLDGARGNDERINSLTLPQIPDPPGGMAAFFSCSKGQRAFESDTLKHGVFFYHLIEGLKGKAGNDEGDVTVPILEDYLTRNVPRTVKREMSNPDLLQIPERRGTLRGTVVLAKVKKIYENELTLDLGNNTNMELVKISAGSFEMGSPLDEKER
ncbi:MAG: caspase family protein [Planctomycetota bacterium]